MLELIFLRFPLGIVIIFGVDGYYLLLNCISHLEDNIVKMCLLIKNMECLEKANLECKSCADGHDNDVFDSTTL